MKFSSRIGFALSLAAIAAFASPFCALADGRDKGKKEKKAKPPGQAKKEAPAPAPARVASDPPPLGESARGVKDGVLGLNLKKVGRSIFQGGERIVKDVGDKIEEQIEKPGVDKPTNAPAATGTGSPVVLADVPIEQVKPVKDARPSRDGAVGKVF